MSLGLWVIWVGKKTELAWAAGFFDGEGCFSLHQYISISTTIVQIHSEVLLRFQSAVGTGTVRGPYSYANRRSPIYRYKAGSTNTVAIATQLWPYLGSVKREQFLRHARKLDKWSLERQGIVDFFGSQLIGSLGEVD